MGREGIEPLRERSECCSMGREGIEPPVKNQLLDFLRVSEANGGEISILFTKFTYGERGNRTPDTTSFSRVLSH